MFYDKIRTKLDISYISICSLSILYNSKFILMAKSLGTNAVVVTRVHCIMKYCTELLTHYTSRLNKLLPNYILEESNFNFSMSGYDI